MNDQKILSYLNDSASFQEKKEVEDWVLASPENSRKFNALKARYIASTFDETSRRTDIESGLSQFKKKIDQTPKSQYSGIYTGLKYAAMIAVIFGLGYMLSTQFLNTAPPQVVPNNAITLELENGNVQVIKEDGSTEVLDSKGNNIGKQQGNKLIYSNKTGTDKLTYNTLTVPYGKRFDVVLSDSTHVVLNSGTSIKYPVKFLKGKERLVYLEGEAFFDVAKDKAHPFVISANGFNTRVLGTQFNISSYPEDQTTNTVLVEGSVSVYEGMSYEPTKAKLLTPGQMATYHKNKQEISIEKADISLYTAWINGKIIFRHTPFKNIIKKLERQYDVTIVNNNRIIENDLFTASFDIETIEQVLETFKQHYGIDYTIGTDQIIINPKKQ